MKTSKVRYRRRRPFLSELGFIVALLLTSTAYAIDDPGPLDPVQKYNIQWVKEADLSQTEMIAAVHRTIKAPAKYVWDLIKNPSDYYELSNHLIRGKASEMATNHRIDFWIELGGFWNLFKHSEEIIFPYDERRMTVAWIRKTNLSPCVPSYENDPDHWQDNYSQRWQFVESIDKDTSHYYTALRVPGLVGEFTKNNMSSKIQKAFDELTQGLANVAERQFTDSAQKN